MLFQHKVDFLACFRSGNELTPSSKYDFKFKDYAPWVFRHIRRYFGIDAADYLVRRSVEPFEIV